MIGDITDAVKVTAARGGIDLDAWEEDFMKSVRLRSTQLTDAQRDRLRKIWDRI